MTETEQAFARLVDQLEHAVLHFRGKTTLTAQDIATMKAMLKRKAP